MLKIRMEIQGAQFLIENRAQRLSWSSPLDSSAEKTEKRQVFAVQEFLISNWNANAEEPDQFRSVKEFI